MLHQFDHRFSTYEGATQRQLNVGMLPQPTAQQKCDPVFVVQPRYWIREDVVVDTPEIPGTPGRGPADRPSAEYPACALLVGGGVTT